MKGRIIAVLIGLGIAILAFLVWLWWVGRSIQPIL